MLKPFSISFVVLFLLYAAFDGTTTVCQQQSPSPIRFELKTLPFRLDSDESVTARNVPETMAGGVAVFDYNGDGRPDIFFTNGADLHTLKKTSDKYSDRLYRNDGNGVFTDVTTKAGLQGHGFDSGVAAGDYNGDGRPDIFFTNGADLQTLKKTSDKHSDRLYRNDGNGVFTDVTTKAGLQGHGFDSGVAAGDYDNDGHPDLFVMGVHGNTLYRNNGDGTFADVTKKAGLDKSVDPEFGPLYGVAAAWVDVNNDGLLDLFVVNYLQWTWSDKPLCTINNVAEYCHPRYYKGLPDQLFLNNGDGTFKDVSKEWGIRDHVGKGMGVGVADFDLDGKPDLFVTNDAGYSFLFHNLGNKFEEIAFQSNIALPEEGAFISGMGLDFRDFDNDGSPDVAYVALNRQTFPLFRNTGKGDFTEVTAPSGMTSESLGMSGFGPALYDFDNDGWKDLFVSRGHVSATHPPGAEVKQPNSVFRNLGSGRKWQALTEEAGFAQSTAARHRGCALGDFDGDGRIDIVVTSMDANAELWMNRSPSSGHWLDIALRGTKSNRDGIGARIKVVTKSGAQYNHQTSSVCYASSSLGPVHFGLGPESKAQTVQITWPSGIVQTLENVDADRVLKVTETASAASSK